MPGPLDQGRKGVAGTFTPTPVRGTGSTERLSTHRADDERVDEGFDRDVLARESLYRVQVRPFGGARPKPKRRAR